MFFLSNLCNLKKCAAKLFKDHIFTHILESVLALKVYLYSFAFHEIQDSIFPFSKREKEKKKKIKATMELKCGQIFLINCIKFEKILQYTTKSFQ